MLNQSFHTALILPVKESTKSRNRSFADGCIKISYLLYHHYQVMIKEFPPYL